MLAKTPQLFSDLLLVVAVPPLKGGHRLPYVLAPAPGAGHQVQDVGGVTGQVFLDLVLLLCVCTAEGSCLPDDRAAVAALTFETPLPSI